MNEPADDNRGKAAPPGPRWPLDLMKSLGEKHRYFDRPKGVGLQAGVELETLLLADCAAVACARGLALVMALAPSDFVTTSGDGDAAQDVYAAVYAGRHLRIGLCPYWFVGQPPILTVTITALPAAAAV